LTLNGRSQRIAVLVDREGMGDVILKAPFLHALRRAFPDHAVWWIATHQTAMADELRRLFAADVAEVIIHAALDGAPLPLLKRLRALGEFDLVFDSRTKMSTVALARLGLPPVRSVGVELRATSPPPVALGLEQLARAHGTRARAEIVWRKFVPPPSFIRHWDPRAGHSRSSLLRAYLRRPLWILRRAPQALYVWHRARRSVRAGRRTHHS